MIPNAIQVMTKEEKHFFTSFSARDKTYLMLFRVWQFALLNQVTSELERKSQLCATGFVFSETGWVS